MFIIVYTSDKTSWAVRPLAYLFNHYWERNLPVYVFGNTEPDFKLPPNFHFNSIGEMLPVQEWSTGLIEVLQSISSDVVLFLMDDYWLNRQVDYHGMKVMYQYMQNNKDVARFDVTTDRLYARGVSDYCKVGYLDVLKSDPLSPYHFSYQASFWRRELLLQCIKPRETPWESEVSGDERLRNTGALVLGTRQSPMRYTIAVQKGKFTPDGGYQTPTHALNKADIDYILAQGWIPEHVER